ncbi:MAG: TRAP transporter small permease [Desulfobacteraceae bacterium]|nr:TRAP transporter small permease [Desulfobacteraceae bacterium]
MGIKKSAAWILDNVENYLCQILLSFFIILLFIQILLRVTAGITLPWSEELSRFAFVWFVFFGASYAARLRAHNRVTFQLKLLSPKLAGYVEASADIFWLLFNGVIIYKSIALIRSMMEFTYHSPTLGWSMAYVYLIFPISFTLMSIRIIQVNYLKLVKHIDIKDPDAPTKAA